MGGFPQLVFQIGLILHFPWSASQIGEVVYYNYISIFLILINTKK
jgi:hypothetical protein